MQLGAAAKELSPPKLQSIPAAKELSPPKLQSTPTTSAKVAMDITESHLLSSNSSTSSSSDEGVIQHPSPKVSTHVHGLGYHLHPLCIMMHNTVCLVTFMGCYICMYFFHGLAVHTVHVHVHVHVHNMLIIRATCFVKYY